MSQDNMNNIELDGLIQFFSTITEYPENIVYNGYTTITDVPLFVKGHLDYFIANPDKKAFKPYQERLEKVKEMLEALQEKKVSRELKKAIQKELFE